MKALGGTQEEGRKAASDQRKTGLDQGMWEQRHKSRIQAAAEQCRAPKVRPEIKGTNNPRRPKKGHSSGEMLPLGEEQGGEGSENFICWHGEQRDPELGGKEKLKIPWEKLLESW